MRILPNYGVSLLTEEGMLEFIGTVILNGNPVKVTWKCIETFQLEGNVKCHSLVGAVHSLYPIFRIELQLDGVQN